MFQAEKGPFLNPNFTTKTQLTKIHEIEHFKTIKLRKKAAQFSYYIFASNQLNPPQKLPKFSRHLLEQKSGPNQDSLVEFSPPVSARKTAVDSLSTPGTPRNSSLKGSEIR